MQINTGADGIAHRYILNDNVGWTLRSQRIVIIAVYAFADSDRNALATDQVAVFDQYIIDGVPDFDLIPIVCFELCPLAIQGCV